MDRGFAQQVHDAAVEGATKLVGSYWNEILAVARGLLAHPKKRLEHSEVVSLMRGLDI